MRFLGLSLLLILVCLFLPSSVQAIVNPLSVTNNKFGIHIISPTEEEVSEAAQLVNTSGGDWGYITFLIEEKDRDLGKWQKFFNELRRQHLIPVVRLATKPVGDYWKEPGEEYKEWAKFLDSLNWPTKNRYVIVYNEPNQAKEWGGTVNPVSYAKVLDGTIKALKIKSSDFFVLNAGFDASSPHSPPQFYDEEKFLIEMEKTVPGIFEELDGWTSHSYPNPGFVGGPSDFGRGSIQTFSWELKILSKLGVRKNLPVFITETGWKHAEGINYDRILPTSELVGNYFQTAFQNAWKDKRIVAVTPFVLNYQDSLFDHFSFKKPTGLDNSKVLGIADSIYYPQYQKLLQIAKAKGAPVQENKAQLIKGEFPNAFVTEQNFIFPLTFKNTGQSIWNDEEPVKLALLSNLPNLEIEEIVLPPGEKVEPDKEYTFNLKLKTHKKGNYKITLNLFNGSREFDNSRFEFAIEVKDPVILKIKAVLSWKNDFSGEYFLMIKDRLSKKVILEVDGSSNNIEDRSLLPGSEVSFTLGKPFYKQKTINKTVYSGINLLDFGNLRPDILSVIFNPRELWRLLPFSS